MAHIFDVLSTINGQLNILTKDYSGQGKAHRLNQTPDFMVMAVNRAIDTTPGLLEDPSKNASMEKPALGSTGDYFNPVYLAVVDNITKPIVDKVPIMVNYKDAHGPGTAYVVGIPKKLFLPDTDSSEAAVILRDIYLPVLNLDKEMEYDASPAVIVLHDDHRVKIKTYDLTMMLVAIGCINVNLRNWYVTDSGKPVGPSHMIAAFPEFKSQKIIDGLTRIYDRHGKNINELRDAVANGKLVRLFMYNE